MKRYFQYSLPPSLSSVSQTRREEVEKESLTTHNYSNFIKPSIHVNQILTAPKRQHLPPVTLLSFTTLGNSRRQLLSNGAVSCQTHTKTIFPKVEDLINNTSVYPILDLFSFFFSFFFLIHATRNLGKK